MANKYFTYGPSNTDQLLTTTLSEWAQTSLEDQVFSDTPLLMELYKKAKKFDGGASLLVPLMVEANGTSSWYSGYDQLDTTPQNGLTVAQAKWKNIAASIAISGEEERQNSGKGRLINLLDAKKDQCILSLKNDITTAIFASTTGSKAIESLNVMIDASSTVQDIDSSANSYWQATSTASGSFAARGLSDMRTLYTTIAKRNPAGEPDMVVTTDTIYNYYEGSLTPQTRYTSSDNTGNASFESLKFKRAKVFYDAQATSGVLYMFPSNNLYIAINSNADYKTTPFVKPSNQDAKVAQVILMCNLVTNARRKLGKLTGITA